MALLLSVGLLLLVAGPVAGALEPELVGSFSKTYRTTTTSTDFHLAIGLAAPSYFTPPYPPDAEPVEVADSSIGWAPTYNVFNHMTPGAFLFENIPFGSSSEGETYTISSVSDDSDFDDFAAFLTNGTDDHIWEAYIWPMDPVNAGGIRCNPLPGYPPFDDANGLLNESDVFTGTDVGTDYPGRTIQSVSLTFDNIYTVHSGDFDWLTMDYTVEIYAASPNNSNSNPTEGWTMLTTILIFILPIVLITLALVFDSIVLAVLGGIASIFAGLYFITLEDSAIWIGMIFIGLGIYFMLSATFSEED